MLEKIFDFLLENFIGLFGLGCIIFLVVKILRNPPTDPFTVIPLVLVGAYAVYYYTKEL